MSEPRDCVIRTENLTKQYNRGSFTAVDRVSFEMYRGEMLGLLGESGCGKSTLAGMIMHLIKPTEGKIFLNGVEIQDLKESVFRNKRHQIQMVYQNPFACLDPSMRVRKLLEEPLKIWFPEMDEVTRLDKIRAILNECELQENCLHKYPKEFSGGQLQRLAIARALLVEPEVLVADEIISALDVSVQNQVLSLLMRMKESHGLSILFITHDLSVAKMVSDRVMVMQSGHIKGIGMPAEVFSDSSDPYIRELEAAVFTFKESR